MRKTLSYIMMFGLMAVLATSCHKDYDNYTTCGEIELTLPTSGNVEIIQYSVSMTNLNSRDIYTLAGKTQRVITIDDLLLGAYSINVEGIVSYQDDNDEMQMKHFRAQSEFVPFVDVNNKVTLEMVLMD